MVWYGIVRYGMVWHGMVWFGELWYGGYSIVWLGIGGVPCWLKKGLWVGVPPLSPFGFGRPSFQSQKGLFVS